MPSDEREAKIRELLARVPLMTADQRQRQLIGFAYGNVAIDEPTVTRDLVEAAAAARRHG